MRLFKIQTIEEFLQWSLVNSADEYRSIAQILYDEDHVPEFSYWASVDDWITKNMSWILPIVVTKAESGHRLNCTMAGVSWHARPKYACYKQLFFAHHKNNPFRHILYAWVCIISAMK